MLQMIQMTVYPTVKKKEQEKYQQLQQLTAKSNNLNHASGK